MIGQTISHYKILEELGKGGMGVVYKAEDTKLKRTVALKFITPQTLESIEEKTRFVREAQASAALDHPNICTIYEIDEAEGQTFIAMAHIKGQSLKEKVRKAPLKLEEALEIAMQVTDGLQEAHEKGITHRDIKSSNIMITDKGQVKIMDFGLAKLAGGTKLTKTATIMGTADYMSPEQASGEAVDHRTDIWSLGVVIYEMLTGQLPFKGNYEQVVLHSVLNKNPQPITGLRSGVPLELEAIVNKCLEKDPTERYQTAADVKADLKRLRRDMTSGKTSVPITKTIEIPRRFPKFPSKIIIPFSAVILMLLLLLFLPSARQTVKNWMGLEAIPEERGLAVLPFTIVGGDSEDQDYCEGLVETLTSKLTQLERLQESLWVIPSSEVRESGITSPSKARETLGVTLVITESWQRIGDEVHVILNLTDTKTLRQLRSQEITAHEDNLITLYEDVVNKTVEMLEIELLPQIRNILAARGTTESNASLYYQMGQGYLQRAEKKGNIDTAINLFNKAIEQDSSYALAYAGLGEAFWKKYKLTKNSNWIKKAQSYCIQAIQMDDSLAPAHVTLGITYKDTGKYDDAIKVLKRSLELDLVNFDAHKELASVYEKLGKLDEAEAVYKKAIDLKPGYWRGYSYLGVFYYDHGRLPDAEKMFLKILELAPENPEKNVFLNSLGVIYVNMGQYDLAEAMFKEYLSTNYDAFACSNLGNVYFYQKRYTDAVAMFKEAIKLKENDYRYWGNLADAYRYIPENSKNAQDAYQLAIHLANKELEIDPKDGYIHGLVAFYYAHSGEHKKALDEIDKARNLAPNNVHVLLFSVQVFELINQRDQALQALKEYIEHGGPIENINADPDLSGLRKDPRYRQVVK